jgi:peroxiredoxin Q/BCP
VFVVDKSGKVLAAEPGGPMPTVEVVKRVVASSGGAKGGAEKKEDKEKAETAAEVADTAAKVDGA